MKAVSLHGASPGSKALIQHQSNRRGLDAQVGTFTYAKHRPSMIKLLAHTYIVNTGEAGGGVLYLLEDRYATAPPQNSAGFLHRMHGGCISVT